MQLSLTKDELRYYIRTQLNNYFPDKNVIEANDLKVIDTALDRLEYCFQRVSHTRYNKEGVPFFNHLYADHYLVFLWFLANSLFREKDHNQVSAKLYYLNKTLHAFDCMYDTGLPDIFLIFHGSGTMLGKATYNDYFVALHGCTIGSHKGHYPVMGKGVALTAHGSVIGNCNLGKGVTISAHTAVFEKNIDPDTVVFTDSETGKIRQMPSRNPYAQQFFNVDFRTL